MSNGNSFINALFSLSLPPSLRTSNHVFIMMRLFFSLLLICGVTPTGGTSGDTANIPLFSFKTNYQDQVTTMPKAEKRSMKKRKKIKSLYENADKPAFNSFLGEILYDG
jgi:hypothetical protein